MISLDDYFGRFSGVEEPGAETRECALDLLARVNALLSEIDMPEAREPKVNSGWRPKFHNATVAGAAPNSKHITGNAIDLADAEGALDEFLFTHQELLVKHGLYLEHPLATKGWSHCQSVPPRSGNRVFFP